MKIFIAADHAGIELKNKLVAALKKENQVEDLGPYSSESVDYPDFADQVCKKLKTNETDAELAEFGILICGSAQGMAMRANKFSNIRAALVWNDESVKLAREHNNANIICIGSRFYDFETALRWINFFKNTSFAQGRHQTRVAKVSRATS
ncbi:MAG: RpiB/LacA/LacB family sugar-phosphate isomerase [Bdellovibrionota bacterium]